MRLLLATFGVALASCLGCNEYALVMDVQGHRGARGHFPENTLEGFQEAIRLGATTLELDVVVSADKQVVVSHEPWLNSEICSDPQGKQVLPANERAFNLYHMPYDSIKACDCGSMGNPGFPQQKKQKAHKPLLSEVFAQLSTTQTVQNAPPRYSIEVKYEPENAGTFYPPIAEYAALVLDVIRQAGQESSCTLQSFDLDMVKALKELRSEAQIALLVDEHEDYKERISELGFYPDILSPWHPQVDLAMIRFAQEKHMKVVPWTANEREDLQRLVNLHVDGIITDYPDRLNKLLNGDVDGGN